MPYRRIVHQQTPLAEWQDLRLGLGQPAWSDSYLPARARLLIPRSDWLEMEVQGRRFSCDALNAVWLTPDSAYRMRQPCSGQRSLVLVLHAAEAPPGGARLTVSAQTLMMFARWQASARAGIWAALAFEEDVMGLVQDLAGHTQGGRIRVPRCCRACALAVERRSLWRCQPVRDCSRRQQLAISFGAVVPPPHRHQPARLPHSAAHGIAPGPYRPRRE